ncbi:uncharacterized protein LOC116027021 [Ipomoea triloba]|uniref:uncharacterized protein LOC116027021 n=1 Tax=Ipomoea triloba TaxID=35885 RepID=UPI00125DE09A|nr:uncharacterized protein LOC116027021 [Ipomoea triloba]
MTTPAEPVVPPPDETMTEGEGHQRSNKKFKAKKRFFAETVSAPISFNGEEAPIADEHEWAFEDPEIESDGEMEEQDPSDSRPRVRIPKELRRELCQEWKLALIIKYLGKNINFNVLNQRIPNLWRLQGKYKLMDIRYGCFVIRFEDRKDYLHVLLDGPWKVFDNYLVVQRWEPKFKPRTAKLSKMAVWVRLPNLYPEYFRDDVVKMILENIGKPLKLDRTTATRKRGRFARAAVEVDLDQPLVTEIWVQDEIQFVEEQTCPLNKAKTTETSSMDLNATPEAEHDEPQQSTPATQTGEMNSTPQKVDTIPEKRPLGSWMLVTRKKKPSGQTKDHLHDKNQTPKTRNNANRYEVLGGRAGSQNANRNNAKGKGKAPVNDEARVNSVPVSSQVARGVANPRTNLNNPNASRPPNATASSSRQQNNKRGGMHSQGRSMHRGGGSGGRSAAPDGRMNNAWLNQNSSARVFTFGSTQSAPNFQRSSNQGTNGLGTPNGSTPGEGVCQTSSSAMGDQ